MQTSDALERTNAAFATTHWTLLGELAVGDQAARNEVANRVVTAYWAPVYACARRLTRSREDAAELTQAFFVEVVLGRRLFERAEEERGRLRSIIQSSLRRFAVDQWRRERSRGGDIRVPLGDLDREDSLGIDGDSAGVFDRRWALAVFHEALQRCEGHFSANGKGTHWALFEKRVLRPAVHSHAAGPLEDDARAAGFASPALAAAAVQTVKRRFDATLREVVGETVSDPSGIDNEVRQVRELLGRGSR